MLPLNIRTSTLGWLRKHINRGIEITDIFPLSGGSINYVFHIVTSHGNFLLKYNSANKYPEMFESESKGLSILRSTETICVPDVYTVDSDNEYSYILMKFEHSNIQTRNYWEDFANKLSQLHKVSSDHFGLDHNNYIGSLPQDNSKGKIFTDFLINNRLLPHLKLAVDNLHLSRSDLKKFEKLFNQLPKLISDEKPSLIHGDLWSGNLITNDDGEACLIDPAIYFGHRETDIAMTKLFGGFPLKFYKIYNEFFPMVTGWEERIELHQLYPILVHINLFGNAYVGNIRSIINKY